MLEYRRRLDDIKGLPHVKTNRADQFFEKLQQNVRDTDQYVHTWDGELYLEFHRGTYTSQAYNKLMNRKMELLYRETEWLNVLSSIFNTNFSGYPYDKLLNGWKIILRNQFHDILPGTALPEVYEDSKDDYEEANDIGIHSWYKAVQDILSQKNQQTQEAYTIFNSAPWERTDVIELPIDTNIDDGDSGAWLNEQGNSLKARKLDDKWLVQVDSLPSMGYSTIYYKPNKGAKNDAHIPASFYTNDSGIVTPYYRITWNQFGQLTEVYDKQSQRQILVEGEKGNVLQVFEDKPTDFDAWNIDISYREKMKEISDLKSVRVIELNAIRSVVRFKWDYMNSTVNQDMAVYTDNPRIDFKTEVDWHEQEQLLKVAFPVNIRASEATYDIQYGNAKRPTNWNTSWNYGRYETVGHQWADLSEGGYGVSLLNDCKYGYDIKDNVMRLTLIKSATYPDPDQDQGRHVFTYAISPHEDNWYSGQTVQRAWELNNPLTYAPGKSETPELSFLYHDADNIMVDAVKKAENEDKVMIRVHEFSGSRGTVHIQSDFTIQSWQETNLMEQQKGDVVYQEPLTFYIKPYEIKTFLVDMI